MTVGPNSGDRSSTPVPKAEDVRVPAAVLVQISETHQAIASSLGIFSVRNDRIESRLHPEVIRIITSEQPHHIRSSQRTQRPPSSERRSTAQPSPNAPSSAVSLVNRGSSHLSLTSLAAATPLFSRSRISVSRYVTPSGGLRSIAYHQPAAVPVCAVHCVSYIRPSSATGN